MDELTTTRKSKRQKIDKTGRILALEKLKQLKHSQSKYKEDEIDNLYDEVDEEAYHKIVLKRQYDDWIVDDGGASGYLEDGREIFDDDLDEETLCQTAKHEYIKGPRKRKRMFDTKRSGSNIISIFSNMINKKKVEEKIVDDDILGDLMSELNNSTEISKYKDNSYINQFQINAANLDSDKHKSTLVKENVAKTRNILDDLDGPLYEKSENTFNKSKIKNDKVVGSSKVFKEIELSSKTDDYDSRIKFETDNISSTEIKNQKISVSEIVDNRQNGDMLKQYIGDISDIDFCNMKMDTSIINIVEKSYKCNDQNINNNVKLCNDTFFNKVWKEEFNIVSENIVQLTLKEECLSIPTIVNAVGEKVFRFFWLDAFEDPYKYPGQIYLFGKVYVEHLNEYVSCCINVRNIPRRVYLLPREYIKKNLSVKKEPNTMINVYNDFNAYARSHGIQEFRCIEVTKNYAFERENIPQMAEYLEVRYPSKYSVIESDFTSSAIEAVFGTSVNALELFLIERNIKGPCWLDIRAPLAVNNKFSWCKIQVNCSKMEDISVIMEQTNSLTIPPIVTATINVQVCLDLKNQKNEIVTIGILLHNKFELEKSPPKPPFNQHFCLVTHPRSRHWPLKSRDHLVKIKQTKVICCDTELDLLEQFLNIIQRSDPDIIIGYDCGFQFDVLMDKIFTFKIKNWSVIGKLKRATSTFYKGKMNLGQIFCGRPLCDIVKSAKELNLKVRNYDLVSLCKSILNKKDYECKEIKPENCSIFYSSTEKLENLIQYTMVEASYILGIVVELNILPLAIQITNIAGNTLSRTLSGGRAERNEFLLLHAFHNKGFILPDKKMTSKNLEQYDLKIQEKKKKKKTSLRWWIGFRTKKRLL